MSEANPNNGNGLAKENQDLKQQIAYLQNLLRTNMPTVPTPEYPNLGLPATPEVAHKPAKEDGVARMDCEGVMQGELKIDSSMINPPPDGKPRIMIAIPMLAVSYEFFESFLRFWTQLVLTAGNKYEVAYHFAYRKPVHMAEEYLVKIAQANKCTHILFMDDDIYDITPADLDKLLAADKDVIGGIMHASKFPHAMCAFRRYDPAKKVIDMPADTSMYRLYEIPAACPKCSHPQTHWDVKFCPVCGEKINIEVQKADLIPFAFTLMKISVFDKIKKPWFHCTNNYPTDSWFADRLLEVGLEEYAHMTVRLNHAGITDETRPHFMQMGMAAAQRKKAVVNLSPEQMQIHQDLLINKMRKTEEEIKARPLIACDGKIAANAGDGRSDLTLVTTPGARMGG